MISRRRRIIFYFETHQQLQAVKTLGGRDAEVIAASDSATVEAAIRLYKQVDLVLVERQNKDGPSLRILASARQLLPSAKRVIIASSDAITGVYEAVYDRVIDSLLFAPCREEQLRDALGLPAAVESAIIEPILSRGGGANAPIRPSVSRR